jgi:hypothetical protein
LFPVKCCLGYQKMKQRIVGGGNGAPETGLPWPRPFTSCKMPRLLKQVVGKGHLLGPLGVLEIGLLGKSPVIEICVEPEIIGHHFFVDCRHDAPGDVT